MQIERLSNTIDAKSYLKELRVDGGAIKILASKMSSNLIYIRNLHVGGANILKQDALSVGADLAVPRGTVICEQPHVDCILIATTRHLEILSKKELSQPFGLKELAKKLSEIIKVKKPKSTEIMGVLNANADSFFSESRFVDAGALPLIQKMIDDGANIIDIGGMSSAPNSKIVDASEELRRVKPILDAIKENKLYDKVDFSIDSYEPKVIKYALDSGFKIVNDITGLENDEVCKLCAEYNSRAIIMHMQGTPQTMQIEPKYESVLSEIYNFFQERIQKAESFGIKDIVLDVGIGFGKTLEHNLKLIKHLEHFLTLEKQLLVGASRKSMIDKLHPSKPQDRLAGTLALHLESVKNGASMIRVHDVREHVQAIKMQEALSSV
jgi:dihydropteroate synthase